MRQIAYRVVALDGQQAIQTVTILNMSFVHRIVDGVRGKKFLKTLASFIEDLPGLLT